MHDDLSSLTAADIDALPFGYIALAPDGTIRKYNRYEADLARKDPQEVLGRNFFREVAPCTQVREFEGRFRELVSGADAEPALHFDFEFGFRHGSQRVRIGFVRSPLRHEVIVTVNRLRSLDLALSATVTADPPNGSLHDAAGLRMTVANEDFWRALDALWRHAPAEQRHAALHRIGHEWGLQHSLRVERLVQRQHGLTLREAELQLALECLSGSLGVLGLGRFDVVFSHRQRGLLVIEHHGSPFAAVLAGREETCCDLLAGLHAGFLTHLSGRPLLGTELRCGRSQGEACLFAVGTEPRLERLLRAGEGSSDAELLASLRPAAVETGA
jgi:photoactive yellow protein